MNEEERRRLEKLEAETFAGRVRELREAWAEFVRVLREATDKIFKGG